MTRMSMKDLKSGLSAAIAEVEAGRSIVITRHAKAVAHLVPAGAPHVHAAKSQKTGLKPAIERATRGRYLAVLAEDRGNR